MKRKGRESNPQGREARPGSSGVPSPVGLPFRKAAEAGIEPASRRLTVAFPYQHRTHRIMLFSQDGRIRTDDLVLPGHAEYQTFPRPESKSAQWESNPHIRHGKAVGCRYIMGACWLPNCQRSKSTGRDSNPRSRCTRAVSWPLDDQCLSVADSLADRDLNRRSNRLLSIGQSAEVGPDGLEPSPAWVRTRDAAANTSIPFVCIQSARWELNPRPASYKDAALTA